MTTPKQALHLALQFRQGSIHRFAPRIEDYGPLWAQQVEVKPHGFPDTTPDPVARHGLSQRAWNGETDPWPRLGWFAQAKGRKKRTRKPGTSVINFPEIL
jgi:hypothetical protein